jgi:hypothetical protein
MNGGPWRSRRGPRVLLAAAVFSAACGADALPPAPSPPPPPPNNAPLIRAIEIEQSRLEVGGTTTLVGVVEDVETPPASLRYEWAADAGTFTGEGAQVTWQAPAAASAALDVAITLTVVEAFTADGVERTNRSMLTSPPIRVHDSRAELRTLAETFLRDFIDSSVAPETCVRNFADSCRGKAAELEDIIRNRRDYTMLPSSRFSIRSTTVVTPWSRGEIVASCEFRSIIRRTGETGTARGTCSLTAVYEESRWWLCDSRFTGTSDNILFQIR